MKLSEMVDVERGDYTTKEIAELVGVSQAYLRRVLGSSHKSALRGKNVGGRLWLVSGQSLKRWLELREEGQG